MEMSDFRTWPKAGRNQLRKALLKGKELYLERCLRNEAQAKEAPMELLVELLEVRQELKKISLG